jgi:hypothetical protein
LIKYQVRLQVVKVNDQHREFDDNWDWIGDDEADVLLTYSDDTGSGYAVLREEVLPVHIPHRRNADTGVDRILRQHGG